MTPLNTIIEEESTNIGIDVVFAVKDLKLNKKDGTLHIDKAILKAVATAMQRAYEAGQSEERARIETHIEMLLASERARIRESFNEWFKNSTEDVEDWADRVIK